MIEFEERPRWSKGAINLMRIAAISAAAFASCWVAVRYAEVTVIPLVVATTCGAWEGGILFRSRLSVRVEHLHKSAFRPFALTCAALLLTGAISPPETAQYSILVDTLIPWGLWGSAGLAVAGYALALVTALVRSAKRLWEGDES